MTFVFFGVVTLSVEDIRPIKLVPLIPKLLLQKRFVSDTAIFVLKRDDKLQPTSRTGEGSKPEGELANQDGMMV